MIQEMVQSIEPGAIDTNAIRCFIQEYFFGLGNS